MKPFTEAIKQKIATYVKKGLDISELIEDVDIKGQNLNYAVIKNLHLIHKDISNASFVNAVFGEAGLITSFINCNLQNCNFEGAKFLGKTLMHKCNAKGIIFRNASLPDFEYRFTDFSGATFCHMIVKLGTEEGMGCIFPQDMFDQLTKSWGIKVTVEKK